MCMCVCVCVCVCVDVCVSLWNGREEYDHNLKTYLVRSLYSHTDSHYQGMEIHTVAKYWSVENSLFSFF